MIDRIIGRVTQSPLLHVLPPEIRLHPPLSFIIDRPRIGWHHAIPLSSPLLAQPGMHALSEPWLVQPFRPPPPLGDVEAVIEADARAANNPATAGRQFRALRRRLDARPDAPVDGVYVSAVFGEALWAEIDAETLEALDRIIQWAAQGRHTALRVRATLLHATALQRHGRDDIAAEVIATLCHDPVIREDASLRVVALIAHANLEMNRALRYTGGYRDQSLATLRTLLLEEIPHCFAAGRAADSIGAEQEQSLVSLYILCAEYLLSQGRPLDAVHTIRVIQQWYSTHPMCAAIEDPAAVSPLAQLVQSYARQDIPTGQHLLAAFRAFCERAHFSNNHAYWATASLSAVAGAVLGAGWGIANGSPMPYAEALQGGGVCAAASVSLRQCLQGWRAEETRQSLLTGYVPDASFGSGMALVARGCGTYLLFGGGLPGVQWFPDMLVAERSSGSGHFFGLGALFSGVIANTAHRIAELSQYLSIYGDGGWGLFWDHWAATSYFAETLDNLAHFDAHKAWDVHRLTSLAPDFFTLRGNHPAVAAAKLAGAGYVGLSTLFALLTMHPRLWELSLDKIPWARFAVIPGVFAGTIAGMVISNMTPTGALGLELFSYFVQYRYHVQGGGDKRIYRWSELRRLDLANFLRAGAVQLIYLGPGVALSPELPAPDMAHASLADIARYIRDAFYVHAAMVPFLAALGVFHGALTGLSIPQMLKAKYAKAYTYEIFSNVLKVMFKWESLIGNILSIATKEYFLGAAVTMSFREAGGSRVQRDAFRREIERYHGVVQHQAIATSETQLTPTVQTVLEALLDQCLWEDPDTWFDVRRFAGMLVREIAAAHLPVDAQADPAAFTALMQRPMVQRLQSLMDAARRMHDAAIAALQEGNAVADYRERFATQPVQEQLLRLTEAYFAPTDHRTILQPRPLRAEWYRTIVYRALTDPYTSDEVVEEFLSRVVIIAQDAEPTLADVRYNLLLATVRAIGGAAHGERLFAFFRDGPGAELAAAYRFDPRWYGATMLRVREDADAWRQWENRLRSVGAALRHASFLPGTPRRFLHRHLRRRVRPADPLYGSVAVAGRRWDFSSPLTGRSVVENAAPVFAFFKAAVRGDTAFQTRADPTFYRQTLLRMFLQPFDARARSQAAQQLRKHPLGLDRGDRRAVLEATALAIYRETIVAPLLEAIEDLVRDPERMCDPRFDVRHNLTYTVRFAGNGPHAEFIRAFLWRNAALVRAQGLSAEVPAECPAAWSQMRDGLRRTGRALIRGLFIPAAFLPGVRRLRRRLRQPGCAQQFDRQLRNAANSTDGKLVRGDPWRWPTIRWR